MPHSAAQQHLANVRRDASAIRWTVIAGFSAVLGLLAFRFLASWPAGLVVTVATATALTVWDRRTGTITGWWPGEFGDAALAAAAVRLERAGWRVLSWPDRPVYLFVGPGGVVLVERQVWAGIDRITTNRRTGIMHVGDLPAARRGRDLRALGAAVHEALADAHWAELPMHLILAIRGQSLPGPRTTLGITMLPITEAVRHIRHLERVLAPDQVDRIATTAHDKLFGQDGTF